MAERSPVQKVALLVGAVFLLVGILGFIPGITSHYDDLKFAGHDSDAQLLGLFEVSILHNIVHLLFGVAGIALSRTWEGARQFLIGGGIVYLLLFVYGLFAHGESGGYHHGFRHLTTMLKRPSGVGYCRWPVATAKKRRYFIPS